MLRNIKFFIFSSSSLRLVEVRNFKTKLIASGVGLGLCTIGVIFVINHYAGDVFGLASDKMSVLTTENKVLKEQLSDISRKLDFVQRGIETLSDKGNELRLMVDLNRIDDDTRSASSGGSQQEGLFPIVTGETGAILENCQEMIGKLTREVTLQKTSYEDIQRKYQFNTEYFKHLPAIKPMAGPYSINGFGMRLHPVLRVYKLHEGIDIANDVGTNVYATGDGTVRYAGRTQGGYGIAVDITHGYGYSSFYAHLSKVLVQPGQQVKRGELIALSGRSGLVSGPNLHYEVRLNGRKQNPVDYFFDDVDAARYRIMLAQNN
jgi:murein DD-endopeptidase MepM/ murein hydrolase activator NlpD